MGWRVWLPAQCFARGLDSVCNFPNGQFRRQKLVELRQFQDGGIWLRVGLDLSHGSIDMALDFGSRLETETTFNFLQKVVPFDDGFLVLKTEQVTVHHDRV